MYEVLLVTEASGQHFNINAYSAANRQNIASFKGGKSQHHSLTLRTDEHIVSAVPNKTIIQVYELSKKIQQPIKLPLPGIAKCLCISQDGALLAAGIKNNVLVWELAGGELLAILSRHYQTVTCLAFSNDDSYLAASGEDGIVSIWDMGTVWDSEEDSEPYHSWTCHTMAVTDIKFGLRYRVYSASLDCSVKIHDVPTCQTIMTVVFEFGISTFTVSPNETSLFVGCTNGSLHKVNLRSCGHTSSTHEATGSLNDVPRTVIKSAHSKSISCLVSSLDGTYVVTGADDCEVKFWDCASLQCLKTMKFSDMVTNLQLVPASPGFNSMPRTPVSPFPRLHRQVKHTDDKTEMDLKYFKIVKSQADEVPPV